MKKSLPGKLLNLSGLSKQESTILFYTSVFLLLIIGLRLVIIVLLQPIKGLFFLMMLGVELLRVLFVVTFIYSYWRMGRVQVDLWGAPQQM